MKTFMNLSKEYAGRKIKEDFEETGNAILAPYGLEIVYGDMEIMIMIGREEYVDHDDFTAYACIMYLDENNPYIDNIHVEFGSRYPEKNYPEFPG